MLTVTQNAVEAIGTLKASSAEIPDEAGLRIAAEPVNEGGAELQAVMVAEPDVDDVVVDAEGEQIFLEPLAASLLDGKVLDARVTDAGIAFAVGSPRAEDENGTG